jgi:general secretion pathway protein L
MSRVVGVDIRDSHVRAVALNAGIRKLEFLALSEELRGGHATLAEAVKACLDKLPAGGIDTLAVHVDGVRCFSHQLTLPENARKRLGELLPFELEAVLPVDVDELVFDYSILSQKPGTSKTGFSVLAVATRLEHVQETIDLIKAATGRQPERIGCSSTELGELPYLIPSLKVRESIALIDFGYQRTDICIVSDGEVRLARSLSLGVDGFPDSSNDCLARLRQTFGAYTAATGDEVQRLVVMGEGAAMDGFAAFLTDRVGISTELLPQIPIEGLDALDHERAPFFAKAFSVAMHGVRGKGFDLRKGGLAYERGYEHVKAKAPIFGAMVAAVLLSFLFSVWAESRALAAEHEALLVSLGEVTKSTFGVETSEPDEAEMELEKARKNRPEDPMPYTDGFGLAVILSEVIPNDIKHDVEEFDYAKQKLKIRGQVDTAEQAQKVAKLLGEHKCVDEPKITKITQVVNSSRERYVLEADIECPEDSTADEKPKNSGAEE